MPERIKSKSSAISSKRHVYVETISKMVHDWGCPEEIEGKIIAPPPARWPLVPSVLLPNINPLPAATHKEQQCSTSD
ncbi:hypothetical protein CEXT_219001 [Caerostris extrusa]|uniref:Uncharacterized protein n=1 Tax=Caerostris extrusa TaxID=172846 RepID=A0AAV4WU61_CAEEX|nr:hypothetical protein CEXT_219001 [Caerostris extrusa]